MTTTVSQFGVFDWNRVEKIIEVGYRYAIKKLDEQASFRNPVETVAAKIKQLKN